MVDAVKALESTLSSSTGALQSPAPEPGDIDERNGVRERWESRLFTVIVFFLLIGLSTMFWIVVGLMRLVSEKLGVDPLKPGPDAHIPSLDQVAILVAAHNEATVIARTIRLAAEHLPLSQIHVVSDGSGDRTVKIARAAGVNVLDLNPNRGKAGAIVAALEHFDIVNRYEVMVLLDADTHLAPDYLETGLKLFADPEVVAVAGRVRTLATPAPPTRLGRFLVAYRERLYVVLQLFLKYGQAARRANAIFIVPGFASMYRTAVLPQIDIAARGLVIEDFNMTFEVHVHALGRIAFHPRAAVAYTQDPGTIRDYMHQTQRWSLGFWQTVRRHPLQAKKFWVALWFYIVEITTSATVYLLLLPVLALTLVAQFVQSTYGYEVEWANSVLQFVTPWQVLLAIVVPDYLLTIFAAIALRRPQLLAIGIFFPLVRAADAWICLSTLWRSRSAINDGRWVSPVRRRHAASVSS